VSPPPPGGSTPPDYLSAVLAERRAREQARIMGRVTLGDSGPATAPASPVAPVASVAPVAPVAPAGPVPELGLGAPGPDGPGPAQPEPGQPGTHVDRPGGFLPPR
jgi:hypothetical protein